MQRVIPILRWPGGKSRLLKKLLPQIPEHQCYGEVFGGGLALFGAKPRSPVEVVNDINGDLIALYLNVQRHLPELLRQIDMVVSSRELLFKYAKQPGLTDMERGAHFLVRNRTSFGGGGTSYGVTRTAKSGGAVFDRNKVKALLERMHERLNGVVIENLTWKRFVELYDSPDTFLFLDPPYIGADPKAYAGWSEADATALRDTLKNVKGRWMVTINDSLFTRHLFDGCQMEAVSTKNGAANNRTHSSARFGELIITP
jgi:DNA adenine methylase